MFGGLKQKAQNKFTDTMKDELTRFVDSLRGTSSHELATLLIIANVVRANLVKQGVLSESSLSLGEYEIGSDDDFAAMRLNKLIRTFQKAGQPSDAAGAMIWLHSVRSIQNPELRYLGRCMWKELSRGFKSVPQAYLDISLIVTDLPEAVLDEVYFVPDGLEPEFD